MSSQIILHVEDNEEIKVVHQSEMLHDVGTRGITITRGYVQPMNIKGNEARYTSNLFLLLISSLPINAPPYQFFQIQYSHHQLMTVYRVLSSHFSQNSFPFLQSYDISVCSLFTLVIRYTMPSILSSSWIAVVCSPACGSYVSFQLADVSQIADASISVDAESHFVSMGGLLSTYRSVSCSSVRVQRHSRPPIEGWKSH